MTPDLTFRTVANAAATAFANAPAVVAYRVRLAIDRLDGRTALDRLVVLRTSDGVASVMPPPEETAGAASARIGAPPALPIVVDALAEWAFHLDDTGADARLTVAYERPRTYRPSVREAGVDVVVTSVAGFAIALVPGEPNHLHLEPVTPAMRAYAAGEDDFVYRDVVFDPATFLPTSVVLASPTETLTLDYATVGGRWLLARAVDEDRRRTRSRTSIRRLEATYDEIAFPAAPPAPAPSAAPLATPR